MQAQKGTPASALQFAGRWRSLLSLQIYVQEAAAALIMSQLDIAAVSRLKQAVSAGAQVLRMPPAVAFLEFLMLPRNR